LATFAHNFPHAKRLAGNLSEIPPARFTVTAFP
jgi:hypothetical protein